MRGRLNNGTVSSYEDTRAKWLQWAGTPCLSAHNCFRGQNRRPVESEQTSSSTEQLARVESFETVSQAQNCLTDSCSGTEKRSSDSTGVLADHIPRWILISWAFLLFPSQSPDLEHAYFKHRRSSALRPYSYKRKHRRHARHTGRCNGTENVLLSQHFISLSTSLSVLMLVSQEKRHVYTRAIASEMLFLQQLKLPLALQHF